MRQWVVALLLETVSSGQDPVLVDEGSAADMDEMFASSGSNLWHRARDSQRLSETFTDPHRPSAGDYWQLLAKSE